MADDRLSCCRWPSIAATNCDSEMRRSRPMGRIHKFHETGRPLFAKYNGKTVSQPPVVRPVGSYITKPLFAWTHSERKEDNEMNEDVFNGSIRKFLKTLGVSAQ